MSRVDISAGRVSRSSRAVMLAVMMILAVGAWAQADRRAEIDVTAYDIATSIDPTMQNLTATAKVAFTLKSPYATTIPFELNNALALSRVTDAAGNALEVNRDLKTHSLTVALAKPLREGEKEELSFFYGGRLSGVEESPVYGIRFAAIAPEETYLLYPARWFPVSGYTTDPFDWTIRVTAPTAYQAIGSGDSSDSRGDQGKTTRTFKSTAPGFGGNIALMKKDPVVVNSEGVETRVYFRETNAALAQTYGTETGSLLRLLQKYFGLPPSARLTLVEVEAGGPNGYAAPGLVFLNTPSITEHVNSRLLVNQLAHLWWGNMIYPESRNHLWLINGIPRYSELLWLADTVNQEAANVDKEAMYIDALTVTYPPALQAARIEDYSPEYWALTASKGAATLEMLRALIGDDAFFQTLKTTADEYANKALNTADFEKIAGQAGKRDLRPFFIQWLESNSAPEFKLEYTVFRTQKGFRVVGKVKQDLDTFSMPVKLLIETEGNPEEQTVDVMGPETEFVVETFGKPKKIRIDPETEVLRFNPKTRVLVAIRRGEQFAEIGQFNEALQEYQKALEVNRNSSLAHYRVAEVFFLQNNYQSAANEFRESLNGDHDPAWTEVWSNINLGKIFDVSGQRERAVNSYNAAIRTRDNTAGAQEEAAKYLQKPYERQSGT